MNDGNKKKKKKKTGYDIKWSRAVRWKAIVFGYIPLMTVFQLVFYAGVLDLNNCWREIEKARTFRKEYCEEKSRLFTVLNKHDRAKEDNSTNSGMMFLVKDKETRRTTVIENLSKKTFLSYNKGDKVWFKVKKKILYEDKELEKMSGGYDNGFTLFVEFIMIATLGISILIGYADIFTGLTISGKTYIRDVGWIEPDSQHLLDLVYWIVTVIAFIVPALQCIGLWINALVYELNV